MEIQGWKTLTGAVGVVLTTLIINYFGGDPEAIDQVSSQWLELIESARAAFAGLGFVGIGAKIDKLTNRVR